MHSVKNLKKHVCHSGGCPGADMTWEAAGEEYGVVTHAYSFSGHTQYGKHPVILSEAELSEATQHVINASLTLKRPIVTVATYVRNLLRRNWFQVKNAESIYAVGKFMSNTRSVVDGGTGWAVQMAIHVRKPIFFYDQLTKSWYTYNYVTGIFETFTDTPILTEQFAGIGTRDISDDGIQAILDVYKNTFSNSNQKTDGLS